MVAKPYKYLNFPLSPGTFRIARESLHHMSYSSRALELGSECPAAQSAEDRQRLFTEMSRAQEPVVLSTSSLPWLRFDASQLRYYGTPQSSDMKCYLVEVRGDDGSAGALDFFLLRIANHAPEVQAGLSYPDATYTLGYAYTL